MFIYYVLLYSTLIFGLFESIIDYYAVKNNPPHSDIKTAPSTNHKKIITILFFGLFTFVSAFRSDNVGIDLGNYFLYFFNPLLSDSLIGVLTAYYRSDIGFYLLTWLIGRFTDNFQIFMFATSVIPLFLFFRFFYKESKIIWLSIFIALGIGLLDNVFNILRQAIAMGIILHGYQYIKSQNLKKFLLCVFLAMTFHSTAIFCIPMYFVAQYKLNVLNAIKYALLSFGLILGTSRLFGNLLVSFMVSGYQDGQYAVGGEGGYNMLLVLTGILFMGLLFRNSVLFNDRKRLITYNLVIMAVVLQLVSLNLSIFSRIVTYYTYFLAIFIPNIISSIKDRYVRVLGIFITVAFFSVLFMKSLSDDLSGIVPYTFFWEN